MLPEYVSSVADVGVSALGSGIAVSSASADPSPNVSLSLLLSSASCVGVSHGMDFKCPVGHYCLAGIINLADGRCPQGTYNDNSGLQSIAQCKSCPPGMHCNSTGLIAPSGPCDIGFYCSSGSAHPQAVICDSRMGSCLLYTSPSPRDQRGSRMPSSA